MIEINNPAGTFFTKRIAVINMPFKAKKVEGWNKSPIVVSVVESRTIMFANLKPINAR